MTDSIRNGAIRWPIPDFVSDGNSNGCSLFHRIRKKNAKRFYLESEGQDQEVEERDLRHSTGNFRIHIGKLFRF